MALFLICNSVDFWQTSVVGSKGDIYIITAARGEFSCECEGYKFKKSCKHILQAKTKYCGWKQSLQDASTRFLVCPSCGEDIQIREW